MFYYRNTVTKATVLIVISLLALLPYRTEAVPREILKSNRSKVNTDKNPRDENTEVAKIAQIESLVSPIFSLVTSIPTSLFSIIGNLTSGATGGVGSLFNKGNSTCNLIDPLLAANIPGIFIAVPLVIIGIALLIGAIAAIVIAIGGVGGEITKSAYDMKHGNKEPSGYQPSIMPMYGSPVSTYGSPSDSSSYSRLTENVDTATQGFNQAYDKYAGLASQQVQPSSSIYTQSSDTSSNQYDGWNNNIVMRRMKP